MRTTGRITMVILALLLVAAGAFAAGQSAAATSERVTLNMFMGNSGVAHPDGIDPSDNWAIKIVEDYADVNLVIEVPGHQDYATKLTLLLASANLPDIVHGAVSPPHDMERAADAGAFVNLKSFYDASPVVRRIVNQTAMEFAASPGGLWYSIPMVPFEMPEGRGVFIRYDMLVEYNGGQWPRNVQGYVDFLKWVKATYPDSIPYPGRKAGDRLFFNSAPFFIWHGVYPYASSVRNGQYVRDLYTPEYRAAVEVMRDLYNAGVLDRDFVSSESAQYWPKWQQRAVIAENGVDQILPNVYAWKTTTNDPNAVIKFAPPLAELPSVVSDVKYTYRHANAAAIFHRTAIAASSRNQQAAWRVIEGFSTPELREAYEWGREGIEFNWENGVRVATDRIYSQPTTHPDLAPADTHGWTLHLGIIQGFWRTTASYAVQELRWGTDPWNDIRTSADWIQETAQIRGSALRLPPIERIATRTGEALAAESTILARTITGEYTMAQFDAAVAEFKRNYGYFDELYTEYIRDNKADLIRIGGLEADW